MLEIAPLLTEPELGKGQEDISFDLVISSLIGYGFSDTSHESGMSIAKIAEIFHEPMTGILRYDKYALRGGYIGVGIAIHMALLYPEHVVGVYMGGHIPVGYV